MLFFLWPSAPSGALGQHFNALLEYEGERFSILSVNAEKNEEQTL